MKEFDKKSNPSREGFSKFLPASMSDSSTRRRLTEYEIQVQDLQAYIRSLEAETVHLRKKLEDAPKDFMILENELAVRLPQLVLEDHEVLGGVLELLPEVDGLGLERPDVGLEVLDLDFVFREPAARARIGHGGGQELREPLATGVTLFVELLHSPSLLTCVRRSSKSTRLVLEV